MKRGYLDDDSVYFAAAYASGSKILCIQVNQEGDVLKNEVYSVTNV